ncbi:hypothetical protein HNY73_009496 [Argiope bruennichi]|uniref:Uncharacterized protein n=1 Tax=Argiope bruennichi TaxID=94029 RepID=A0A8T0FFA7_ARGBR|nr:hypothetical protein HNY73_009496 [Argiope bruennichi]
MSRPLRKRNVPSEKETRTGIGGSEDRFLPNCFLHETFPCDGHHSQSGGYTLIIDASHREHADEHGLVTRSMIRKHKLPKDIKIATLRCSFTGSGFLVVHAER